MTKTSDNFDCYAVYDGPVRLELVKNLPTSIKYVALVGGGELIDDFVRKPRTTQSWYHPNGSNKVFTTAQMVDSINKDWRECPESFLKFYPTEDDYYDGLTKQYFGYKLAVKELKGCKTTPNKTVRKTTAHKTSTRRTATRRTMKR